MLQSMGSQRVRHDLGTDRQQQTFAYIYFFSVGCIHHQLLLLNPQTLWSNLSSYPPFLVFPQNGRGAQLT